MAVVSKTVSVAVASVVAIMVGVVIAASLGTQDDVHEAADPQPRVRAGDKYDICESSGAPVEVMKQN